MFFFVLAVYAVILVSGFFILVRRSNEWMDVALIAYLLCAVTYIAQDILRKL